MSYLFAFLLGMSLDESSHNGPQVATLPYEMIQIDGKEYKYFPDWKENVGGQ